MSVTISAYQLTSIQDRGYLLPDVTHLISISIEMMLRVVLKGMVFPQIQIEGPLFFFS